MMTRTLTGLALLLLGNLLFIMPAEANVFPQMQPCLAKKMHLLQMLPDNSYIIQVMGHQFRKADECVPFYVTFTWENHYDRDDGYSQYSLQFVQTFIGELWYSSDSQEFTLVANPAHWKGTSYIKKFDGYGQACLRFDENDKCLELHKFDRGYVRAIKTPDEYLVSLSYAYPAVAAHGQSIPITLHAFSPIFEFRDAQRKWRPNGGLIKINNPALISIDFPELVKAASTKGTFITTINYNRNNDLERVSNYDRGKLVIKLDFDPDCEGYNNSDMDPCQQIASLLDDLQLALHARDLYPEALLEIDNAPNYDIDRLVVTKLHQFYPYITAAETEWMLDRSGRTDPKTLNYKVPDGCNKCTAKPLCEWENEAIIRHEEANVEYLNAHPDERDKLMKKPPFTDANKHYREVAKILSAIEYRSYNERAKYLKEIIYQELNQNPECTFDTDFYSKFQSLIHQIK